MNEARRRRGFGVRRPPPYKDSMVKLVAIALRRLSLLPGAALALAGPVHAQATLELRAPADRSADSTVPAAYRWLFGR